MCTRGFTNKSHVSFFPLYCLNYSRAWTARTLPNWPAVNLSQTFGVINPMTTILTSITKPVVQLYDCVNLSNVNSSLFLLDNLFSSCIKINTINEIRQNGHIFLWLFHISKLIECLDTVFFILSGKLRLVTWLHVYHHSTMIPYTWVLAKWIPGSQAFNLVLTNGSVHVVMYTYYALAALGPAWRKYLWWKRYLTILQMVRLRIYTLIWKHCALSLSSTHWNVSEEITGCQLTI
ncbi:unnamed protein product [Echinostoma caproni]|uniref:Elongation of very long chain fatty acids protein n=1 Tax=Echinostoma caproni TaxID=27848 RepID=A0A183B6Z5_9TREM|nr:unnamed protein product [Echinostoma caproni]